MKLIRVQIFSAETCGGLLDGLNVSFRSAQAPQLEFDPLCLIGPNGTGKSQFLQVIAEIFQSLFHAVSKSEERDEGNSSLQFEVEYLIAPSEGGPQIHVRASRRSTEKKKASLIIEQRIDNAWMACDLGDTKTLKLLPRKIVAYTSGDNETLSLPFLISRSGYADEVSRRALVQEELNGVVPDTRLMLIDYGTHLEVLVANLLLGSLDQRDALIKEAHLDDLYSFRCVVQLAHGAISRSSSRKRPGSRRKGVQLTKELEQYLDQLSRCSTCSEFDEKTESYTFDFLIDAESRKGFKAFWETSLELYSALHKLAMLNDLAIPKITRDRFKRETKSRSFASRLPEPQDESKVFRFERVCFFAHNEIVDYVSLSDGEHQLAQLLGTFSMISFPGVLFLLDEPESHFNPLWRVKFISRLLDLPGPYGSRRSSPAAARQEVLLTTHSPFVPSDMAREKVLIFEKNSDSEGIEVRRPDIETFGATFDAILDECFGVRPPMSSESRKKIEDLLKSNDPETIRRGMEQLGHSVEKTFLADHLRQITKSSHS
jgi:restriction system-associated AAA family ATPase